MGGTMTKAIHCDGPSCITWTKEEEVNFFELYFENEDYAFCSWDCLIKFAAIRKPIEEIRI